jgi:hypothetical protein
MLIVIHAFLQNYHAMNNSQIPRPIISLVAEIISNHYTHAELNNLFLYANAPGNAPDGSKLVKCQTWISRCNDDDIDALKVLGKILEDYMEHILHVEDTWGVQNKSAEVWQSQRDKIDKYLASYGLGYCKGGIIRQIGVSGATKSLEQIISSKDFIAIDVEFNRALENITTDPPASLTAACAIIESVCKIYIEEHNLTLPKDSSIKPLWATIATDLGFDASRIEDNDLRKVLTGLSSIVDGIGALRTHAGSAHGRGQMKYKIQPRHARLAVHAAHTLTAFLLESWENKDKRQKSC